MPHNQEANQPDPDEDEFVNEVRAGYGGLKPKGHPSMSQLEDEDLAAETVLDEEEIKKRFPPEGA